MSECKCERCSDSPSQTYLPNWRIECEARYLLTVPLAARREYLAAKPVQGRREVLEAEIRRQWEAGRGG